MALDVQVGRNSTHLRTQWQKKTLSRLSRCEFSTITPPYADALEFVRALLDAFTLDACLWASDWPFRKAPQRLDMGR